jgi:hypothetical protein
MDAESNNYKMTPCPRKTKTQCLFWGVAALALLVFFASFAIVGHIGDWSFFKSTVIAVGATFSIMWCFWVIHTFRSIMGWWVYMHQQMETVTGLLAEAKQDLRDIKTDIK